MVKPQLRTKTLGTKVSEEEFAQLGGGQRARVDSERVVPGNSAGQRERPGGEIRRFRQSRPGAHGGAGGAAGRSC